MPGAFWAPRVAETVRGTTTVAETDEVKRGGAMQEIESGFRVFDSIKAGTATEPNIQKKFSKGEKFPENFRL